MIILGEPYASTRLSVRSNPRMNPDRTVLGKHLLGAAHYDMKGLYGTSSARLMSGSV